MVRWRFLKKFLNVFFFRGEILLVGAAVPLFNSYKSALPLNIINKP